MRRWCVAYYVWEAADANVAENVVIDLYKGDAWIKTIATAPSTIAYKREVNLDLEAGSGYSIKVRSETHETLSDTSDGTFALN